MLTNMLIGKAEMESRSVNRYDRPLRLLYSGRYEPLKGAVDAVKVGMECLGRGLNIEMHCYGQGSQKAQMQNLATDSRMHIHDAIPLMHIYLVLRVCIADLRVRQSNVARIAESIGRRLCVTNRKTE
jgi:hypothetical protein